jgi:hypothetical protein
MSTELELYPLSDDKQRVIPLDVAAPLYSFSVAAGSSKLASIVSGDLLSVYATCFVRVAITDSTGVNPADESVLNSFYLPAEYTMLVTATGVNIYVAPIGSPAPSGTLYVSGWRMWKSLSRAIALEVG